MIFDNTNGWVAGSYLFPYVYALFFYFADFSSLSFHD